ncbi:FAD dependent oxidoreductase [Stachybotrys elegans]|uniref:FAD dependent oxidoreductase n=1 Tax=Stachybotrys elegans TaxID=80388 RepID=A0A8K0WWP2_9HYPO|nr:FAD dependent oxidoreductase [Stachybotrys elegans]
MSLPASPHVVVIGGGIVGSSIAWHLAKDANVTIIAENIGGVATPNSFAWLNAAYNNPRFYYDFRRRSMQRWHEIGQELPELPIHWGGSLNWDGSPEEMNEYLDNHASWGYDIVRVEHSDITDMEPNLNDTEIPEWGLHVGEEGAMEAHIVAAQLIAEAEALGATVLESSVTGFLKEGDLVRGVRTSNGEVLADHVVVAAGLGSVELLATENIPLPVSGREGMLINTKPIKERLLGSLVNAVQLHFRQTAEGRIRSGSQFSGGNPGDDPEATAQELFAKLQSAFNGDEKLEYDYYTIGVRPDPEDGLPILGPTGVDGLSIAVMHSGVTNAAIVGDLLSKQIIRNITDPILSHFRLDRFSGSSTTR